MSELMISQLQWLRPWWLLLLLATPLVYWLARHRGDSDSGWSALIPQHLLAPLLPEPRHSTADQRRVPKRVLRRMPRINSPLAAVLAFSLISLALAGPVLRQAPSPAAPPANSLVIVLDLSLSMLATDVQPNRLTLAKRKVRDILAARQGSLTALVVYAADAHGVTPLSDDSATTESMLAVLEPVMMPAAGNRADLAVRKAMELLERGAPGNGRILLITDDVQPRYRQAITELLTGSRFQLDTLTVGTRAGGPIPLAERGFIRDGDRIVISQAAPETLAQLAAANGGRSATLTLDGRDLSALAVSGSNTAFAKTDAARLDPAKTRQRSQWQEDGYWLLWLALPLLLLIWRRGALALFALALLPTLPQPAQALSWGELWQREDQRAPALIEQNPKQAAEQLQTPEWQGTALYRSGEFEAAGDRFADVPGAEGAYNRGNALAQAGKLAQAIAAYDQALTLQPQHPDALANRALVGDLLQQQEQEQEQQEQGQQQDPSSGQDPGSDSQDGEPQNSENSENAENSEDSGRPENGENGRDQQSDNNGDSAELDAELDKKSGSEVESEIESEPGKEPGPEQAPADTREAPLSQSQEQYLRRVPDNPGGLLQQKFLQQYRQRQTPADRGDTPW
ncbi:MULTISPECIES: VWA domain-containing protein [unclassified Marinobacter]|uniref:VWA domain-containing protein n=1 Tax=unclassified Marinobacter TaxID=83889 RepID=UPI00200E87FC|nr:MULTISPECIES: VWA domain-containing protein [unclassified Marinobacter]UQG57256.1 VWA domain-containing protein [Marinobacter sp. M4C]UQG66060.1 VWA domain-containing protein [Marinobacter sp. M2C]UQG70340.1 VWA domain-containing protein [Marinobacter sp. M1C]